MLSNFISENILFYIKSYEKIYFGIKHILYMGRNWSKTVLHIKIFLHSQRYTVKV